MGNLVNQRYWPNIGNGIAFTGAGEEVAEAETGTHWYPNSAINGTTWDDDWINGQSDDGVDLNGGGNDGLIRIQHTKRAEFLGGNLKDYIRNGFVAWNCDDVVFDYVISDGQFPTTYFEQVAQFGAGYECAAMKVAWPNSDNLAPSDRSDRNVNASRCRVKGGYAGAVVKSRGDGQGRFDLHAVNVDRIAASGSAKLSGSIMDLD